MLNSGKRPEVLIGIPEMIISLVKEKSMVSVHFDAIPAKKFKAVVTEIGVPSGGMATTFPVKVRLVDPNKTIKPGMAAEVTFRFKPDKTRTGYLLPPVSVLEDKKGRFVYVVQQGDDGTGIVQRRDVTAGKLTSGGLEILTGLRDGEVVVAAGVSRIKESQKVRLTKKQ